MSTNPADPAKGEIAKAPVPNDQQSLARITDDLDGNLKDFGGSICDGWNSTIMHQVVRSLWLQKSDGDRQITATIAALHGIRPRDELEGMIAAQMLAAHDAAMESFRRAVIEGQTFEGRAEYLNQANKLSRTYAILLEALNRHRGKGQQKVTVEHVHVHAGGQAVVGMIETPGGGDCPKPEDQPHAIAHAPRAKMPCPNPERQSMRTVRDAERPLPDARRHVPGRAEG